MVSIILIAAIAVAGYFVWTRFKLSIMQYEPQDFPDIIESVMANATTREGRLKMFVTNVAGISFHAYKRYSNGIVVGCSAPEPDNSNDPNAVVLRSWKGRKLGYISRGDIQVDFAAFAGEGKTAAFVCYIKPFAGQQSSNAGEITFYIGTPDQVRTVLARQLEKADASGIPVLS